MVSINLKLCPKSLSDLLKFKFILFLIDFINLSDWFLLNLLNGKGIT